MCGAAWATPACCKKKKLPGSGVIHSESRGDNYNVCQIDWGVKFLMWQCILFVLFLWAFISRINFEINRCDLPRNST